MQHPGRALRKGLRPHDPGDNYLDARRGPGGSGCQLPVSFKPALGSSYTFVRSSEGDQCLVSAFESIGGRDTNVTPLITMREDSPPLINETGPYCK